MKIEEKLKIKKLHFCWTTKSLNMAQKMVWSLITTLTEVNKHVHKKTRKTKNWNTYLTTNLQVKTGANLKVAILSTDCTVLNKNCCKVKKLSNNTTEKKILKLENNLEKKFRGGGGKEGLKVIKLISTLLVI